MGQTVNRFYVIFYFEPLNIFPILKLYVGAKISENQKETH